MDIVASLAKEARDLARRLLVASETASQKLERIFSTLLSSDVDIEALDKNAQQNAAVGHGFAIMFLLAGVTGMPRIQGKDAQEWMTEWKAAHPGNWDHQKVELSKDKGLPRSYGSDIAGPLYSTAMQIGKGNRERADDLVMEVYAKFWGGAGQHIQAVSLKQAIGFVQKSVYNLGANVIKKQDKRERSLTRTDDEGEEVEQEIAGDHDLEDIMDDKHAQMIVHEIMTDPRLKSELEHEHVDALQYLQLLAQGFEDPEILGVTARGQQVGKPMLHHPLTKGTSGVPLTPQNWNPKKHRMFDLIKKHFTGGHAKFASYDYDRSASV
jgi:DNA-directed RNA polymerase specialized sigma24 family protein